MDDNAPAAISVQVDKYLPTYRDLDEEELLAIAGQLTFRDVSYSFPLPKDYLVRLGRKLIDTDESIREAVCSNKEIISLVIEGGNISALVALLAPALGFPPAAVPGAIVALAVLILRIGLIQYCQGVPVASPSKAHWSTRELLLFRVFR